MKLSEMLKATEVIKANAESSSSLSHSKVPNLTYHESLQLFSCLGKERKA